jgi:competence protein ComEA
MMGASPVAGIFPRMATQSEQKALAFVAIVVLLAGAVRVVRAGGPRSEPTTAEQQGLARQAFAANSAAVAQQGSRTGRGKSVKSGVGGNGGSKKAGPRYVAPRGRDTVVKSVGGVETVPWNDRRGFPPPLPRIDIGPGLAPSSASEGGAGTGGTAPRRKGGKKGGQAPAGPVNLDTASVALIETLPRVGPALAHRIVANRDSLGPFRSLEGLRRVQGIGPATVALLGPLVTFSRQARP